MLIQQGIVSSGVAIEMNHISHIIKQFSESLETLRLVTHKRNFTAENEHLVYLILKDLMTQGYRLTDGICSPTEHEYYANRLTKNNRNKRQLTSIFLLLTTVGSFLSFIIPSMHQQVKPYQLSNIQRHLQMLDQHTEALDDRVENNFTISEEL